MYLRATLNCLEKGQEEDIQGDVNEIYESSISWIGGTCLHSLGGARLSCTYLLQHSHGAPVLFFGTTFVSCLLYFVNVETIRNLPAYIIKVPVEIFLSKELARD